MRPTAFTAAVAAAALSTSLALAQGPGGQPPAATRTVNLTVEQRHIIRELVREEKVAPATVDAKVAAGETVPQQVQLHPIPTLIGQKVPQVKSHRFFVTREQIVLVDPTDNRIADVIE